MVQHAAASLCLCIATCTDIYKNVPILRIYCQCTAAVVYHKSDVEYACIMLYPPRTCTPVLDLCLQSQALQTQLACCKLRLVWRGQANRWVSAGWMILAQPWTRAELCLLRPHLLFKTQTFCVLEMRSRLTPARGFSGAYRIFLYLHLMHSCFVPCEPSAFQGSRNIRQRRRLVCVRMWAEREGEQTNFCAAAETEVTIFLVKGISKLIPSPCSNMSTSSADMQPKLVMWWLVESQRWESFNAKLEIRRRWVSSILCAHQVAGKRWRIDLKSRQEAALMLSAVNLPGGIQVGLPSAFEVQSDQAALYHNVCVMEMLQHCRYNGNVQVRR